MAAVAVLAANTIWVDSRIRPTSPRDGGTIIVPGARVAVIEGVGHSPMVEAPTETVKLIEDFLK